MPDNCKPFGAPADPATVTPLRLQYFISYMRNEVVRRRGRTNISRPKGQPTPAPSPSPSPSPSPTTPSPSRPKGQPSPAPSPCPSPSPISPSPSRPKGQPTPAPSPSSSPSPSPTTGRPIKADRGLSVWHALEPLLAPHEFTCAACCAIFGAS